MGVFQNNLLAGAAAAATSGASGFYSHQIEQSVRFDRDSSSGLSRTFGTPTSQKKYTLSLWIKRTKTCEEIDGESNDWMHIMCRNNGFDGTGAAIAFNNIFSPMLLGFICCEAFNNAIPPPGTIPSFKAALVA